MKKIALVFYGLLRNVDATYPYWKNNVIDPLHIEDIYVHTYRDEIESVKVNNTGTFSFKVGPSVLTEFYKLYKPSVVMHSDYDDVKKTPYWFEPTERVRFCLTQTYSPQAIYFSMYNAVNLVPEGKYDYVILSKVDQIFLRQLKEEEINPEDDEIYTSNFMHYKDWDGQYWSVTDFFAIGNLKTIKKYASVGINYKKIYDSGVTFHVETTIGENLKNQGVKTNPHFIYPDEQHYFRDHESLMIEINNRNK